MKGGFNGRAIQRARRSTGRRPNTAEACHGQWHGKPKLRSYEQKKVKGPRVCERIPTRLQALNDCFLHDPSSKERGFGGNPKIEAEEGEKRGIREREEKLGC